MWNRKIGQLDIKNFFSEPWIYTTNISCQVKIHLDEYHWPNYRPETKFGAR